MKKNWRGIGVMSGTSLDGVDLALCEFSENNKNWDYKILKANTFSYPIELRNRLANATQASALELVTLNNDVATFFSDCINFWVEKEDKPDYIASHGHTVFHQPERGLTTQIGNGAIIAAQTKIPVVCDFRSKDVALGGQGAPLVPIGDELLFSEYDACLNLGGFSNISFKNNNSRVAFDISPCNMALNDLAQRANFEFDKDGCLSKNGTIISELFNNLNKIKYYQHPFPKSLGKEWFEANFLPILEVFLKKNTIQDVARTVLEHIAYQIAKNIPDSCKKVLITGGGANHKFLLQQVSKFREKVELFVPDKLIVDYKEALIFAFLGLLRLNFRNNCLKSVTGANADSCGGCVYC